MSDTSIANPDATIPLAAKVAAVAATHPVKRLTGQELLAELDRLRAELAAKDRALQAAKASHGGPGISFKVSEKGAVSAYGLGRFPVTLYADQWTRLAGKMDVLQAFLKANSGMLAHKDKA